MENDNNQKDGLAIASFVCGIVSIVCVFCCNILSIPTGVAGLITGFKSANEVGERSTLAKTGIITNIIGMVLCILYIIAVLVYYWSESSLYNLYP